MTKTLDDFDLTNKYGRYRARKAGFNVPKLKVGSVPQERYLAEKKRCSRCWKTKSKEHFFLDETKVCGLSSQCRDCVQERANEWKQKNPEKVKEEKDIYRSQHKEWLRDRHAKQRYETKASIIDKLGGSCKRCGFSDHRALQFDHINGDGAKERNSEGFDWWSWVKKLDTMTIEDLSNRIQILCANCNQIKRIEDHEYGQGKKSRWESGRNCTCVARDRSQCRVHSHLGSRDA